MPLARPSRLDFALGHWLGITLTLGGTIMLAGAWSNNPRAMPWMMPAAGLVFCRAAFVARRRVAEYREHAAAWADAAGETPEPRAKPPQSPARRRIRLVVAAVAAAALLPWLDAHQREYATATYGLASLAFVALAGRVGFVISWGLLRWAFSPSAPAAKRRASRVRERGDGIVAVCPSMPWATVPGPRDFLAALPPYCRGLLSSGGAASAPSAPNPHPADARGSP